MSVDSRFRGNQFFASVANSLKMSTDSRFRGDQLSTWVTDNPETMTRHESCKISYLKKDYSPASPVTSKLSCQEYTQADRVANRSKTMTQS